MASTTASGLENAALTIDRASPVPLYFQVATAMQHLIETGDIPVGTRLENEMDLADALRVSRPTLRRAIQYLVERGMLVRKRGVGTQVLHPQVRRPVELSSLYDDLTKAGRVPATTVLSVEVRPASDTVAQALGIPDGAEVTRIERVRWADGEPLALMRNDVPVEVLRPTSALVTAHETRRHDDLVHEPSLQRPRAGRSGPPPVRAGRLPGAARRAASAAPGTRSAGGPGRSCPRTG